MASAGATATAVAAPAAMDDGCNGDTTKHAEHVATHGTASAGGREAVDVDGIVRRGNKLSDLPILTVSTAKAKASELDGKTVKIEGKVESVCQAMGCWFVLQGDTAQDTIRISSKGHDVYVPRSAAGKVATVEGELKVKTLTPEAAQHFEDERELKAGETRKKFTAPVTELSLGVVALEMRPAS